MKRQEVDYYTSATFVDTKASIAPTAKKGSKG